MCQDLWTVSFFLSACSLTLMHQWSMHVMCCRYTHDAHWEAVSKDLRELLNLEKVALTTNNLQPSSTPPDLKEQHD